MAGTPRRATVRYLPHGVLTPHPKSPKYLLPSTYPSWHWSQRAADIRIAFFLPNVSALVSFNTLMLLLAAEMLVASQACTSFNILTTIIGIKLFYKDPATPVPRWMKKFCLKVMRPANWIIDSSPERSREVNEDNNDNDSNDNNFGSKSNISIHVKKNKIDVVGDRIDLDWQRVAKIIDGFIFFLGFVNIPTLAIVFYFIYIFA